MNRYVWKEKLVLFRPHKYHRVTETGSALGYVWTCVCVSYRWPIGIPCRLQQAKWDLRSSRSTTFWFSSVWIVPLYGTALAVCPLARFIHTFVHCISTARQTKLVCENSLCSPVDSVCANRINTQFFFDSCVCCSRRVSLVDNIEKWLVENIAQNFLLRPEKKIEENFKYTGSDTQWTRVNLENFEFFFNFTQTKSAKEKISKRIE